MRPPETRMTRCSENLHRLVVGGRLPRPGVADLDRHVASAIAVPTGRGWRIDKAAHDAQVDAVIALMAALEGAERQPVQTRLVGWL
ncbi:MAG: hypothetical protein AABM42_12735 [Actinomycetota bacterium]